MTLLYDARVAGQAGTHVLAVGVGTYPYLLGGTRRLANRPLGLKQLASPPVSAKALLDWFLAPVISAAAPGFANAKAPLASVEGLISAAPAARIDTPTGPLTVAAATRDNIQDAFEAWLERLKAHADNIGVFYFCGHGLMVSEHYLLAEDFGRSNAQPWSQALDITSTMRAVEREVPGTLYYFIDACREISRDVALTLGANPSALLAVDLGKKLIRQSGTTIYATGEGELAFAPPGGSVSRFTSALLCALSGYAGVKAPGAATWDVDGETLATATRKLLESDELDSAGKTAAGQQVCEQILHGSSVPLVRLGVAPKVKVWLDLSPAQRRALYELYLLSAKGSRAAQTRLNQVFRTELPRGFYEVGALDPAGALPAVVHAEEELLPPIYALTLQVSP